MSEVHQSRIESECKHVPVDFALVNAKLPKVRSPGGLDANW